MSILKKVIVGSLAVAAIAGMSSKVKAAPKRGKTSAAGKRTARKGKSRAKRATRRA